MASIYKRSGSKTWQAAYFVPQADGSPPKQVRKSTGKRSEREAKIAAAEMERDDLKKAGITDERGRQIQAILVRAGEDAVKMTLNATKARVYLAEILKISTGEDMPQFTVRTWTEEWKARKLPSVAPATRARYKGSLNKFVAWLGEKADRPLESVTVADMRKFRDELEAEGRGARTCQFYVADVGSMFRAALREGLILHNPATALEPKSSKPEVIRKPFTIEEVTKMVEAAPNPEWQGVILLGAFAGLRLGDASKLVWENIDLAQGTLTIIPAKTQRKGRVVTVPIHPELRGYLARQAKIGEGEGSVFPELSTIPVRGRNGLSRRFKTIMESAEVPQHVGKAETASKPEAGNKRRHLLPERSFHSLRHTFTSWLANADVAPELRMKLTGHTTADVHAGYTHLELATLSDAVTKLPKLSRH